MFALPLKRQTPERPGGSWELLSIIFRWLGRALAVLLLLFWGAFFVEHVNEWYVKPQGAYPPLWVLVGMVFHFGILAGLLVSLRWARLGTALTLAATVGFGSVIAWHTRPPALLLINLIPAACFALGWLVHRRLT